MPVRWYHTVGTLTLMAVFGTGCWQSDETPTPEPTQIVASLNASGSPSPTVASPTPQPIPISSVSTEHLPGMVLTQEDVDAVFSNLALAGDRYQSHDDVARNTINPVDTPSDLESRGLLDGYESTFQDLSDLLSLTVSAAVYRWDTSNSAETFIQTEVADLRRLNGNELQEGTVLMEYDELTPPDFGTNVVASRHTVRIETLDVKINTTLALWQRETIVASVRIMATSDVETANLIGQLAIRMNERIDGLLAGKAPPASVPTPQSTPTEVSPENQRLSSMLLELGDLPADMAIRKEGPLEISGASGAYQRRFMAQGTTVEFAQSEVTEIQTTVGTFDNAETARVPVDVLRSLGPEGAGQLIAQGFATGAGTSPDGVGVELLDFPAIGDDSFSLLLHMKTAVADLEGHLVYFVRGRVRAQFVVIGLAGKLSMEDTIPLARLFDQRIQNSTP